MTSLTRPAPPSTHRVKLGGADPHTVASYVNEISLLQRLRSYEHIVTLFDAYVDRAHGYIYMVCGRPPTPHTHCTGPPYVQLIQQMLPPCR